MVQMTTMLMTQTMIGFHDDGVDWDADWSVDDEEDRRG